MVKPSILPEGGKKDGLKDAKGTESSLPAFAVIPLGSDLPPKYDDFEAAPIAVVNRPRKLGVCLCVTMMLTLLLIVGLAAAMFLGHGKFQFRCGVGYGDYQDYRDNKGNRENQGTLEEDVEVNPYDRYEQIEIPEQAYCERLTILHDFTVNMTAYRLHRSQVCYITFLDQDIVMGPDEFIERAEENPEFLTDHYETVHETYRVLLPDLSQRELNNGRMGFYIPLLCDRVESYWIEKIPVDELEAWEEYWHNQELKEAEGSEEDEDDDDHFERADADRRRRAVGSASGVKELLSFGGYKLNDLKIYTKEAVEGFMAKEAIIKN